MKEVKLNRLSWGEELNESVAHSRGFRSYQPPKILMIVDSVLNELAEKTWYKSKIK